VFERRLHVIAFVFDLLGQFGVETVVELWTMLQKPTSGVVFVVELPEWY
jgi:hypothetical protein